MAQVNENPGILLYPRIKRSPYFYASRRHGVQLYSGMKDEVLAMQQTIGSPINTALAPEYEADQIVNFPSAWSKTIVPTGTGMTRSCPPLPYIFLPMPASPMSRSR